MGINEWEKPERIPIKNPLCVICDWEILPDNGTIRDDGFGAYAIHDDCERYL